MKNRHMKGLAIFITVLALMTFPAFSQETVSFNRQFIETSFYSNTDLGSEAGSDFASIGYGANLSFVGDWNAFSGLRLGDEAREFMTRVDFWPELFVLQKANFSFGGSFTYHYLNYGRWCHENDILIEPFAKYTGNHDWYVKLSVGLGSKVQKVKAFNRLLFEKYLSMHLECNKKITDSLEAYFIFSGHDDYRYYIFPSPLYTFGGTYTFNSRMRLDASWQFHCCDMFTSKFFLNGEQFKCSVRIYL